MVGVVRQGRMKAAASMSAWPILDYCCRQSRNIEVEGGLCNQGWGTHVVPPSILPL